MKVNKNDEIQYERVMGKVPLPKNRFFLYSRRKRLKRFCIKANVLTDKNEIITVVNDNAYIPQYTLHVCETDASGKIIDETEIYCGTKSIDVRECFQKLSHHGMLSFSQMKDILKFHGYPKDRDLEKRYKACINNYCRYHNLVSRTNLMLDLIELLEVREL